MNAPNKERAAPGAALLTPDACPLAPSAVAPPGAEAERQHASERKSTCPNCGSNTTNLICKLCRG